MMAVRRSLTSGMLRSSAIWQSGFTLITPPEKASRRLFETRFSRKSGSRLTASIKESRPPVSRPRDHLRRLERQIPRSIEPHPIAVFASDDSETVVLDLVQP